MTNPLPRWYLEGRKSAGMSLLLFAGAVCLGYLIGKDYSMWGNDENDIGFHVLNGFVFCPLLFAFACSSAYFAIHARSVLVDRRAHQLSFDDEIHVLWGVPLLVSVVAMVVGCGISGSVENRPPALQLFTDFAKGFLSVIAGATVYIWRETLCSVPANFFNLIADIVLALITTPIVAQVESRTAQVVNAG